MQIGFWRRGLLLGAWIITACANSGGFTQYPGFEKIRAALSDKLPTAAQRQLLKKYQPTLYIANTAQPPLDFYADYVAYGELEVGDETIANPTPAVLNAHRNDPQATFAHHPPKNPTPVPTAYGAISSVEVDWPPIGKKQLTFLSYHFAFRQSGLPAGLDDIWQRLANVVANSEDWHQLDHYTAVFVVLDGRRPLAVLLQQHNYMRTYFIGDTAFPTAENIAVDAAISSNELYPHSPTRKQYPAASFITAGTVDYLLGLDKQGGIAAATDITDGQRQVDYTLQFLPPNDAFYVFQGRLGEQRLLPGRDGPPGALYRSTPALIPLELALYSFYYQRKDREYADLVRANGDFWEIPATREKLKQRFVAAWQARLLK